MMAKPVVEWELRPTKRWYARINGVIVGQINVVPNVVVVSVEPPIINY